MQDLKAKKAEIRRRILAQRDAIPDDDRYQKSKAIRDRLFHFANFIEARIVLFYASFGSEVATGEMIRNALQINKIVALPFIDQKEKKIVPYKIDNFERDVQPGYRGILEPIPQRCKIMPVEHINLAIIPGIAFDERGGRLGHGTGFYDRFIPVLDVTTRKVALAFESQIVRQIPMEPHDRFIDIIITEDRIIYKI